MLYIKTIKKSRQLIIIEKHINMKYRVYIHTVLKNNKKYVGLSTKENINDRWKNGKGYKGQKVFYNAILKYGWDNISHQVFECDTEAEMKYLERYLIAYYNTTDRRYGYNVTEGGDGHSGIPSKNRKPIDQYDRQGHFIRTWESLAAINKALNYDTAPIINCAKNKRPTAYNCYWCYSGKTPEFKTYRTIRKVYQYDLEGNKIAEFKNAMDAARSLGKSGNSTILDCCNKKYKSAYGYIWSYENDSIS